MKSAKQEPSLAGPEIYEIKVPGEINENWSDWLAGMAITVACEREGAPVTTLTATLDQAALQGLLRRLYALGLPLISVKCLEG